MRVRQIFVSTVTIFGLALIVACAKEKGAERANEGNRFGQDAAQIRGELHRNHGVDLTADASVRTLDLHERSVPERAAIRDLLSRHNARVSRWLQIARGGRGVDVVDTRAVAFHEQVRETGRRYLRALLEQDAVYRNQRPRARR